MEKVASGLPPSYGPKIRSLNVQLQDKAKSLPSNIIFTLFSLKHQQYEPKQLQFYNKNPIIKYILVSPLLQTNLAFINLSYTNKLRYFILGNNHSFDQFSSLLHQKLKQQKGNNVTTDLSLIFEFFLKKKRIFEMFWDKMANYIINISL